MTRVEKQKTPVIGEGAVERDKAAAIASLKSFLEPRAIAVIGASRKKGTIGNQLFHNILHQELNGIVYPVNPNAEMVASVKTYPSVLDIPGKVDLAVVIVPAESALQVVEECGQKGVPSVVVISAGFRESGAEGHQYRPAGQYECYLFLGLSTRREYCFQQPERCFRACHSGICAEPEHGTLHLCQRGE